MNAQAYLERIGYDQKLDNSFETLKRLMICHRGCVPFENLSVFGVGARFKALNLKEMYEEIVVKKQGGYCYELNGLFAWLLRELGFEVATVQANCFVPAGPDTWKFEEPFDHMTSLVTTSDGRRWLADVAWMGRGMTSPLQFDPDIDEQKQENSGIYRIQRYSGEDADRSVDSYLLQTITKVTSDSEGRRIANPGEKGWETQYKFDAVPRKLDDFAAMNVRQQDTREGALFASRNTFCCLASPDGCTQLWGNEIVKKAFDEPTTQRIIWKRKYDDPEEFKKAIEEEFGLKVDFELKPMKIKIPGDLGLCF